jgi:hypothetical protein
MERTPRSGEWAEPGAQVSRSGHGELDEKAPMHPADEAPNQLDRSDRLEILDGPEISQNRLINHINHLNFQDRHVSLTFKHKTYGRKKILRAHPLPCRDTHLTCKWAEPVDAEILVENYQIDTLLIANGQQLVELKPNMASISNTQIHLLLPETGRQINARRKQRHTCNRVKVQLFQNSALFSGDLIDYSAPHLHIRLSATAPQTFRWIDRDTPVTLVLTRDRQTLYSGECRIMKKSVDRQAGHFNLEPVYRGIRRFEPRQFRCIRHNLTPPPDIIFSHPFFQKRIALKTMDLSGSGCSVQETEHMAVLLPGMILPECELVFSDGTCLRLTAQVLYSHVHRQTPQGNLVRCGLAFLDMAVPDHIRLLGLLHQVTDARSYVCGNVDLKALWDFFFETHFIYPQKYAFIAGNKEKIQATFEKLYTTSPSIAAHFTYQDNGRIIAHMAMIRFYESSWLIQHHAAIRSAYHRGGLMVLDQVGRFINESHRLCAMQMDYVFCYFQPENKFPAHIFGGAARYIQDPRICSIDLLAYFHHRTIAHHTEGLPPAWQLEKANEHDLKQVQLFYEGESGGLMLHGLHLIPGRTDIHGLAETYHQIGLKRDRHIFALRYQQQLCALVVVNLSDPGLNLSDLTNSAQIIVTDVMHVNSELIQTAVNSLAVIFEQSEIPVLLYPEETAGNLGLEIEKTYALWVYKTQNLDYYFRYLKRLPKFMQP